jgi:hypothetical protein
MTDDGRLRASDQDRETALGVLRDAYAAGRLRPEEFDQRVDMAFAATTWGELDGVTADLPAASTCRRDTARPPSGTAKPHSGASALRWFLAIHAILVSLIVLMAGLAGRVTSEAVWSAYALIPLAVVLPTFLGRRQLGRHDKAQPPALPH